MADIETPNYLNTFVSAADAGRQMAAQRARQNALTMIGTDPQGAQNALMQAGDFQGAEAVGQVTARQQQTTARAKSAQLYQAGDTQGATSAALAGGLDQLAQTYTGLAKDKRDQLKENNSIVGGTALSLLQVKDPNERAQIWAQTKPHLLQRGVPPAQLENVDLSDSGLQGYVNDARTVEQVTEQIDKDRTFQEGKDQHAWERTHGDAQLNATIAHNHADESNASARLAEDRRHNKASEGDGTSPLTPESVEQIAQQIDAGAPMPNFGMGKAALAARTQVLNRVAEIRGGRGATGYDAAGQGASYKANSAALSKVTTQRSMIEGFEGTARQNGQQVRDVLTKGAGPGTAWFNRPIQALRQNALGDTNVTALNTAIQVYTGEVAKIVSGSTGSQGSTDAMRRETAKMLDPNATPAQILRSMDILDKDMANRTGALRNQERQIRSAITANPNTPPPPAAPAGGVRPPLASFQQ